MSLTKTYCFDKSMTNDDNSDGYLTEVQKDDSKCARYIFFT
jgi:hypothetical protein